MKLFNFWKTKIDLSNQLYPQEKFLSNELLETISSFRQQIEEDNYIDEYDEEGKYMSSERTNSFYEDYSDDKISDIEFARIMKAYLHTQMSDDRKGDYISFEEQIRNIAIQLYELCLKRANIKIKNVDIIDVLSSKNNNAKLDLFQYVDIKNALIKTLINYCTMKPIMLNRELSSSQIDINILGGVLEITKALDNQKNK